jgi:hypothetical protein
MRDIESRGTRRKKKRRFQGKRKRPKGKTKEYSTTEDTEHTGKEEEKRGG